MIENETCDCDTLTFFDEADSVTVFDQGLMAREKTESYMVFDDARRLPYSFIKGALQVDEDWDPLRFAGSVGIVKAFISGETQQISRAHHTFNGVEQTAELLNPFDGKTYFLFAKFDGESMSLDISLSPKTTLESVGRLAYAYEGEIYGRQYNIEVVRRWDALSENVKEEGKTVWHQYPDGAYIVLSNDKGDRIKIFRGATTGKVLGMDAFTGYQSRVYLPKRVDNDTKRDMFLFFYASEFSQDFVDDVQRLPDCLNYPEEQGAGECDFNIVLM